MDSAVTFAGDFCFSPYRKEFRPIHLQSKSHLCCPQPPPGLPLPSGVKAQVLPQSTAPPALAPLCLMPFLPPSNSLSLSHMGLLDSPPAHQAPSYPRTFAQALPTACNAFHPKSFLARDRLPVNPLMPQLQAPLLPATPGLPSLLPSTSTLSSPA